MRIIIIVTARSSSLRRFWLWTDEVMGDGCEYGSESEEDEDENPHGGEICGARGL